MRSVKNAAVLLMRLAVQLGQAVNKAIEPLGPIVVVAVPTSVVGWVAEAEIRRQIDHARSHLGELVDAFLRLAVRQSDKEYVTFPDLAGGAEH